MAHHQRGLFLSLGAWALCLGLGLSGCSETPSYSLRWRVGEGQAALPLVSAEQCSAAGIGAVRVDALRGDQVVSSKQWPCFPASFSEPDARAHGPELPPGEYVVRVRGIRRDGHAWADEQGAALVAVEVPGLVVREGQTFALPDAVMAPPPQCEDGVDNDRDGFVDGYDAACRFADALTQEGEDQLIPDGTTEVRVLVSFLDNNPNFLCKGIGASAVRLMLDDVLLGEEACAASIKKNFTQVLEPGEHTVSAVVVNGNGEAITQTVSKVFLSTALFSQQDFAVDFNTASFLQPIEAFMGFFPKFLQTPSRTRGCSAPPNFGLVKLIKMTAEVVDGKGQPFEEPIKLSDDTPLDGLPRDCDDKPFLTNKLPWGAYGVKITASSAQGEVCFSTGEQAVPLTPGAALQVQIPRILPPPESCRDCDTDADCAGASCVDHICLP